VLTIPAPVQTSPHFHGEVHLDPQAVVAPGVCLIANPGSRIQVGAGVCLGMGTILHADGEGIVLETGVIVGAGVLLIGTVRVGAQSCIGSASTVVNTTIAPGQVIAPGSLLGETGRATPAEAVPEPPAPPPPTNRGNHCGGNRPGNATSAHGGGVTVL
jgi:carbon dioxide concentrating mechanism protein CcmN